MKPDPSAVPPGSVSPTDSTQPPAQPRPTLLPGLRCIWRGQHRLQLGVDPARAVVLELPDPAAANLLELLDGSRSERAVLATATARYQIQEPHAQALLRSLQQAGLVQAAPALIPHQLPERTRRRLAREAAALALRGSQAPASPAQLLRRRAAARVLVTGTGPLAAPIAVTLAEAGVGHVHPRVDYAPPVTRLAVGPAGTAPAPLPRQRVAPAADAGGERGDGPCGGSRAGGGAGTGPRPSGTASEEVAAAITRAAPGTRTGPLRRRHTSFVVQVGTSGPANLAAEGYAQHRLPHLAVSVRDGTVVIGPLVPPAGGPCLHCVDLHRRDRDPEWPELAAQLAAPSSDPCTATTLLGAAALAADEVLCWLDGETPTTLGASVEVASPARHRRRTWPPHPHCDCFQRHLRTRPRP